MDEFTSFSVMVARYEVYQPTGTPTLNTYVNKYDLTYDYLIMVSVLSCKKDIFGLVLDSPVIRPLLSTR